MSQLKGPSFRLICTLATPDAEIVLADFFSLGMLGCEETSSGDFVTLKVYFATIKAAQSAQEILYNRDKEHDAIIEEIENQDWNARWRESMEPAKLDSGFWVSPQWLSPPVKPGDHWIRIEPKMAFGTGHHETTRLASQAIISNKAWLSGKTVLDIGTGSGVLCFVSDICGAATSIGVEIDSDCAENLAENRALNPPRGRIGFTIGTFDAIKTVKASFDLVIMNMLMNESIPIFPGVSKFVSHHGKVILSGILIEEKGEVLSRVNAHEFFLTQEITEKEWWCGVFEKEGKR